MKKIILIGIFIISLFVTSCNKENIANNEEVKQETITVSAIINNNVQTRLSYLEDDKSLKINWSDEEMFKVYIGDGVTGFPFVKGNGNSFSCDKRLYGSGKYYAVYGDSITHPTLGHKININIADQIGTTAENGIRTFMLAESEELTDTTILQFEHKLAILKLKLTLPSDVKVNKVDKVIILGLHKEADYNFNDSTFSYTQYYSDGIKVTNGTNGFEVTDGAITAYVAVFPEEKIENTVTVVAVVGEDMYAYTMQQSRKLTAGEIIPVNVNVTKKKMILQSHYYMWDAYEPFQYITSGTWGKGSSWYNTTNDDASVSCVNCPTNEQMQMYLGAGVYWGDSDEAFILPNGTLTTKGLWIMKKEYITDFEKGLAKKEDYTIPNKTELTDKSKYFFVPVCGYYNEWGYYSPFKDEKSSSFYWLKTYSYLGGGTTIAYNLVFNSEKARVVSNDRKNGYIPLIGE